MKKTTLFRMTIACLFILAIFSCAQSVASEPAMNVIPLPKEYHFTKGEFVICPSTKIVIADNMQDIDKVVKAINRHIGSDLMGKNLQQVSGKRNVKGIVLAQDKSLAEEAYRLTVSSKQILIEASSASGLFYGVQSLRQLVPAACYDKKHDEISVNGVVINDEPTFSYRCGLLDIARHFMSKEDVMSFIDILALHKDNTFHFHVTDDQGWRIEIKKYPALTQKGSWRKETVIGHNTPEYDGTPHGGFLTQKEMKEIVEYAADNFVNVIPELDLPGHMQAALATYPNLGCRGADYPYEVRTKWGVSKEVLCAGNEEIYTFLENVITEMLQIFPYKYFHIGGDECPKDEWKECPKCQAKIKELGLNNEAELQSYVMARIEKFLNKHGRQILGWEEIVEGGVTPTTIVMHWRYDEMSNKALALGNKLVMCPLSHCYFDYYQHKPEVSQPGYGHYIPIDTAYSYDPYAGISLVQRKQIMGVSANAWTEYAKNFDEVTYMFLPRAAALAEVAWTYENRDFSDFCRRMAYMRNLYNFYGWNYGSRQIFSPEEKLDYQPLKK